jgi:hypothetical protein
MVFEANKAEVRGFSFTWAAASCSKELWAHSQESGRLVRWPHISCLGSRGFDYIYLLDFLSPGPTSKGQTMAGTNPYLY